MKQAICCFAIIYTVSPLLIACDAYEDCKPTLPSPLRIRTNIDNPFEHDDEIIFRFLNITLPRKSFYKSKIYQQIIKPINKTLVSKK